MAGKTNSHHNGLALTSVLLYHGTVKLSSKFLLFVEGMVTAGITLVSAIIYNSAERELEAAARFHLTQSSELVAAQAERAFANIVQETELWARLPLVMETARRYRDPGQAEAFHRYFLLVREQVCLYQSINLVNLDADCVASSNAEGTRLYNPNHRKVVAARSDFMEALQGRTGVSESLVSRGTGRPALAISTPIRDGDNVIAVLRTVVDLEFFNRSQFAPLRIGQSGRVVVMDSGLDLIIPGGPLSGEPLVAQRYVPPDILIPQAYWTNTSGFFRYTTGGGVHLAAFRRLQQPAWVVVAEQPLQEVLAPIGRYRQVTFRVTIGLLMLVGTALFLIVRPSMRALGRCQQFARDVQNGCLNRRLDVRRKDEIGLLAQGLNRMAESIRTQQEKLQVAEAQYRGIFESATEGIVQTDGNGRILMVNPAMARMVGYDSPEQLLGRTAQEFYADAACRKEFIVLLTRDGVAHDFEAELVRKNGSRLCCLLHAQAENDGQGGIRLINGIVHDMTTRQRLSEAEKFVAQVRLRMLRFQMNPHFLFNTLNSIDALITQDPAGAQRMIRRLAAFCRASLLVKGDGMSTVGDEMNLIDQYLAIEKVRWGDALQVEFTVGAEVEHIKIPAFILQPLVGNAVKYGQLSGADPLSVRVSAERRNGQLLLEVDNRGRWFSAEERPTDSSTGVGLSNVEQRLRNLYGDRFHLDKAEEDGWVKVRIVLPESGNDAS